jgi:hypothetical protein
MISGDLEVRFSLRKLLIVLFLTVIPFSLMGLFAVTRSQSSLRDATGRNFSTIAQMSAREVSAYVHDRVVQVGMLARMPVVVEAVKAANRGYSGVSESAFQQKVERIESIWNTPESTPIVTQILSSPASRALQEQLSLDRRFLRITLTDERGATIAASHKTMDYYQADEEFWQAIYADGRGAINLTDILYDEVTKSKYIGIGVPIIEEGTNRFIGALDVLMDLASIFPQASVGHPLSSVRLQLVKDDGTIIAAPGVTLGMNMKSAEFEAVREFLANPELAQRGYSLSRVGDGPDLLVAFADTGLRNDYRNLGWLVLVTQDAREALAPVRGVLRLMWFMVIAGLATVTLAVVYFSLHRKVTYEDIASLAARREGELPASQPKERTAATSGR